jgi:hypothetical protein
MRLSTVITLASVGVLALAVRFGLVPWQVAAVSASPGCC